MSFPGHFPSEERISELTMSGWYAIVDELCVEDSGDFISSESNEDEFALTAFSDRKIKHHHALNQVHACILNCVRVMIYKCQYPPEPMNAEDDEEFRIYRINISDLLAFSLCMVKYDCFNLIIQCMEDAVRSQSWIVQESCLYLLGCLIEQDEIDEYLTNWFVDLLPSLPLEVDNRYLTTGVVFVGQLAEIVNDNPKCLSFCVDFCLRHLCNKDLTMHVTMSLRSIARENRRFLNPYAQQIVDKCACVIMDSSSYDESDRSRCMAIIGYALTSVSPNEALINCLDIVITPFVQRIVGKLQSEEHIDEVVFDFSLITNFVVAFTTSVDDSELSLQNQLSINCRILFDGLNPILMSIIQSERCNHVFFGSCMEILSRFLSFMGSNFKCFIEFIGETLLKYHPIYNINSFSLNFVRQSCILFNKTMPELTLKLLCQTMELSLKSELCFSDSDLLINFVQFVQSLTKSCSQMMNHLPGSLFQVLMEFLARGIQLNEPSSVRACSDCLVSVIKFTSSGKHLMNICGQQLCHILVRSMVLSSPYACIEFILNAFLSLTKNCSLPIAKWTRMVLAGDEYFRATNMEKERFVTVLTKASNDKTKCFKSLMQFSTLARSSMAPQCVGKEH